MRASRYFRSWNKEGVEIEMSAARMPKIQKRNNTDSVLKTFFFFFRNLTAYERRALNIIHDPVLNSTHFVSDSGWIELSAKNLFFFVDALHG